MSRLIDTCRRLVWKLRGCASTKANFGSSGPTIKHITIGQDGHTHTFLIGRTSYGKGHAPKGGHKPITIIEHAED